MFVILNDQNDVYLIIILYIFYCQKIQTSSYSIKQCLHFCFIVTNEKYIFYVLFIDLQDRENANKTEIVPEM